MLDIALIIFREFMEVAVLLSIVVAATRHVPHVSYYIILGMLLGTIAAALVAFFTRSLTLSLGGLGDEIFNIVVILLTVILISWTVIWMQGYSGRLREGMATFADSVATNKKCYWFITLIVASTMFREGAEVLLFIYSVVSARQIDMNHFLTGIALGAAGGVLCGVAMYKGLLGVAGRSLFRVTSILLILIAASLASEAANMLVQIGVIDVFVDEVWDTSHLIEDSGIIAKLLKIVFGYHSKPMGIQMIFYLATFAVVYGFSVIRLRKSEKKNMSKRRVKST